MDFQTIFLVVGALVTGAVVALKVIAPITTTKVDDAVLAKLEAIEDLLKLKK